MLKADICGSGLCIGPDSQTDGDVLKEWLLIVSRRGEAFTVPVALSVCRVTIVCSGISTLLTAIQIGPVAR